MGIGPRSLAHRLASVGSSWERIGVALLTHTHGDHIDDATLQAMARRQVPLYCHEGHRDGLARTRVSGQLDGGAWYAVMVSGRS